MDDHALLTPGSVWVRERKGKQFFAIVICTTNSHLPEEKKDEYPEQVVYMDQRGRYNGLPVEQFLRNRTYHDVHPAASYHMEHLLTLPESEELQFEEDSGESQVEESALEEEENANSIAFVLYDAESTPTIDQQVLSNSLASYQQLPIPDSSDLQHELIFQTSDQITRSSLRQAFSHQDGNHYCAVVVGGELVEWDSFVGVFPMHTGGSEFAIAVFRTQLDSVPAEALEVPAVTITNSPNASPDVGNPHEGLGVTVSTATSTVSPQAQAIAASITPQTQS